MNKNNGKGKHQPGTDPQPDKGKDDQHGHKGQKIKPGTSHSMGVKQ